MRTSIVMLVFLIACGIDDTAAPTTPNEQATEARTVGTDEPDDDLGEAADPGLDGASTELSAGQVCTPGGSECAPNEFCSRPVGKCKDNGTCATKPPISQQCTDVVVCGCDGVLYSNGCAAARAGQSVAAIGSCPF